MSSTSPFSSGSSITDTALGNAYPVVKGVYDKLGEISYLVQNVASITEAGRSAITSAQQAALDSNQTAQDREATELNAAQTLADRNAVESITESFGTVQEAIDVAVAQANIASDGASVAAAQANVASAAASVATMQASSVIEQVSLATSAKVSSEAARDAINTTGKVFTSAEGTAAGLAATTNGQQFAVLAADGMSYGIWRNNAGTAQSMAGSYTKAFFDSVFQALTFNKRSGYLMAFKDLAGRIGLGLRTDGTLIAKLSLAASNGLAVTRSTDGLYTFGMSPAVLQADTFNKRSGYLLAFKDLAGRIGLALRTDGTLVAKLAILSSGDVTATRNSDGYYSFSFPETPSRFAGALFKGTDGRYVGFLRSGEVVAKMPVQVEASYATDGSVWAWIERDAVGTAVITTQGSDGVVRKLTAVTQPSSVKVVSGKIVFFGTYQGKPDFYHYTPGSVIYPANPIPAIAWWGDSLSQGAGASTANTRAPQRTGLLLGREVRNYGIGGQQSIHIITRQGGYALTAVVAGNQVPASGSVTVTGLTTNVFYPNSSGTFRVSIGGVNGDMALSAGVTTFTRRVAGAAVNVPNPAPVVFDNFGADQLTQVFWIGQNDGGGVAAIQPALAAAIANLKVLNKRFVVVGVTGSSKNIAGSAALNALIAANQTIQALYPNNYIDVRPLLVAAYNSLIPQDVTDNINGVIPSSLRADDIHLNDAGYAVVSNAVVNFITSKGW